MSLHSRKEFARCIKATGTLSVRHSPDWYESELLDSFSEDDPHITLGRLRVLCAEMLEDLRWTDPTYGLKAVGDPSD